MISINTILSKCKVREGKKQYSCNKTTSGHHAYFSKHTSSCSKGWTDNYFQNTYGVSFASSRIRFEKKLITIFFINP
jgi:hypothetical protein